MSLITAENVTHRYGELEVLRAVSVQVDTGKRVGLVGPNGEGKTTLLRILAGQIECTLGQVHHTRGLTIGYLPQDPPALAHTSIHEACLDIFAPLRAMEDELHDLATAMSAAPDDKALLKRYGAVQHEFEAAGGFEYHNRIDQVLTGLDFPREMYDRPLSLLSGGQRTRAYLATLLLKDPNVLMLDEPTNHLDVASIEWLESFLRSFGGAILVVSHDRYFLDRVTTHTWEVAFGSVETYRAPYSGYVTQRSERHKERLRTWEAQQEYIAKTQDFIRQHIAGQRSREAKGRRTRLERFMRDEAQERPKEHKTINLSLRSVPRAGDLVFRAEGLVVGYDEQNPLVDAGHLEVERADRIAIVGPNGSGKTTLIRTLLGEIVPVAGSVRPGGNVAVGYLSQTHNQLDPSMTVLEAVVSATRGLTIERARSLLGSLLISGDDVYKRIEQISGGQRSRVALARLVVQSANLLVLDEPTNHLDIPSTEIMQDVLRDFDGTIIFVSHDRYLIESVATHIWAIESGSLHRIIGGWHRYLDWRDARAAAPVEESSAVPDAKADYRQARRQANELKRLQRRRDELEKRIEAAENSLVLLSEGISAASQDSKLDLVTKLGNEYSALRVEIDKMLVEWEKLCDQLP